MRLFFLSFFLFLSFFSFSQTYREFGNEAGFYISYEYADRWRFVGSDVFIDLGDHHITPKRIYFDKKNMQLFETWANGKKTVLAVKYLDGENIVLLTDGKRKFYLLKLATK